MVSLQLVFSGALHALPSGASVTHGNATFQAGENSLTVHQTTDKLITNWQSFSISQGNTVRFNQPSSSSAALNRVVGGTRSMLDGTLEANGKIILINPAGITVGPTGVINVNSFTASTLDITDDEFLGTGDYLFQGNSTSSVENHGLIQAAGGDAFLIAREVVNKGTIQAAGGTAGLAAGNEVLVKPVGEQRIYIKPSSQSGHVTQTKQGKINAAAVEVVASGNPYATAINLDGLISVQGTAPKPKGNLRVQANGGDIKVAETGTLKARTQSGAGGVIEIRADAAQAGDNGLALAPGSVEITGVVDANATNGAGGQIGVAGSNITLNSESLVSANGETSGGVANLDALSNLRVDGTVEAQGGSAYGGTIKMRAQLIELGETAVADVSSSEANGGRLTVGGEFQGGIDPTGNAQVVIVESGAQLNANAGTNGDGGTVIVWSDTNTFFYGDISATGGTESGDGGFAEVSGKQFLSYNGFADLSAATGALGTLLLDPNDITIVAGAGAALPTNPYAPGTTSIITWGSINATAANVTIQTTAAGTGGNGDIFVAESGVWTSNGTLTLIAERDINLTSGAAITVGAGFLTGSFNFQAGRDFNLSSGSVATLATGSGTIGISAGNNVNISGGSLTTNGSGYVTIHADQDFVMTGGNLGAGATTTGGYTITTGNDFNFSGGLLQTAAGDIGIQVGGNAHISNAAAVPGSGAKIRAGAMGAGAFLTGNLTLTADGDLDIIQNQYFADLTSAAAAHPDAFVVGSNQGNTSLSGQNVSIHLIGNSYVGRSGNSNGAVTIAATNGDLIFTGTEQAGGVRGQVGNRSTPGAVTLSATRDLILQGESYVAAASSATVASELTLTAGRDFIMQDGNLPGSGAVIGSAGTTAAATTVITAGRNAIIQGGAEATVGTLSVTADNSISVLGRATLTARRNDLLNSPAFELDLIATNGTITIADGATLLSGAGGNGDLRLLALGDISIADQASIKTNATTAGIQAELRIESQAGGISITGQNASVGIVGTQGSGTVNLLADGDITLERTTDTTNLNLRTLFSGASGKADEPTAINIISQSGDIRVLGTYHIGLAVQTNDSDRVGDITLSAANGSILVEGRTLGNVITNHGARIREGNISLNAQSIQINELVWLYSDFGNLTLISTVGDIAFNNSTAFMSRVGSNARVTDGIKRNVLLDSMGSIHVAGNVAFLGQSTSPTFSQEPSAHIGTGSDVTFLANDDIIFGAGAANVVLYGGGNLHMHAGRDGTGSIEFGPASSTAIRRILAHDSGSLPTQISNVSLLAADDIRMLPTTPNINPTTLNARFVSRSGNLSLTAQNGDITLARLVSGSGDISVNATNGSILDSYGARTMTAAGQANITTSSGDITLNAADTIGQGNLLDPANPIATTRGVKLEMGSESSLQAHSTGAGATEGIFISAWKDLIIGSPSTGMTAVGDIVVSATNNLYVDGDLFVSGAGRSINLLSNSNGANNAAFLSNPGNSGDIILNGSVQTTNGNINLVTGLNLVNGSILDSIAGSSNDIRYIPTSTDLIFSGSGDVVMRANRNIGLGRIVTDGGDITVIAGNYNSLTGSVAPGAGQIFDVFPLELRDGAVAAASNINTLSASTVTLLGGSSVGLLNNGQDIDLAIDSDTTLNIRSWGTNTAGGDGVYLSYLGDFSTDQANTTILSAANLGIQVTGSMEVAAGSSLSTENNGSIWLTALGITGGLTSGDLTIDAAVTAHGFGTINIVGVGRVTVNDTVSSTSGNISIVGAGRADVDQIGVDVTANGYITTGAGGTIHLAALSQQTADEADVTTGTSGQVRVGDVVINGVTATSVEDATYLQGTTYGEEVISGGGNSVVNGVGNNAAVATTSQQASISGGSSNGAAFNIDAAGNVIINTNGAANAVSSTGDVSVSVVDISNADTTVFGGAGAQVETSTGTIASTLSGGTITINGVQFQMSGGTATVGPTAAAANMAHTITASGSEFESGTVNSTGGSTTITSGNGSTSSINSGATGEIVNIVNHSATGLTTILAAGSPTVTFSGSGSVTSSGATTVFDNGPLGTTTVGSAGNSILSVGSGSAELDLQTAITANGGTVTVNATNTSSVAGVSFGNLGTVVFDGTNIDVGSGTSSVVLTGASNAILGGATATASGGSVTVNTTGIADTAIEGILNTSGAATGGVIFNAGVNLASNTVIIGAGYGLSLTGNTISSTGTGTGITVSAPTSLSAVTVNNVSVVNPDSVASAAVGDGLTSAGGTFFATGSANISAAEVILTTGATITLGADTYTSLTTVDPTTANWSPVGNSTVYVYNGSGGQSVSNVTLNTAQASSTGMQVQVTASGVNVTGQVFYDTSSGKFYTNEISLNDGQFQTIANYGSVQLTGITGSVAATGGTTNAANIGTFNLAGFAGANLAGAGFTATASASFTNVAGFGVASQANVTTTGIVATSSFSGVTSTGAIATYAGTLISNSLNTVTMANPTMGPNMSVASNGALVNIAGIDTFTPTGSSISSNSSVRIAERLDGSGNVLPSLNTAGGDIYVSASRDGMIAQLDARGTTGLGGDIFVEATSGSVINNLSSGTSVNLVGNHTTLVGGTQIGSATAPIEMDVASVYLDAGANGAYLEQAVGRDLRFAGVSIGDVAIVNDRQLIADAFQHMTFGPGVGINFTDRRWYPDLQMVDSLDLNAGASNVYLRAIAGANGNIISDGGSRVIGQNLFLDASGGVGESTADRFLTDGVNIWFDPGASVYISELNAVTVGGNALAAGAEIDILTEQAGNLTVTVTGPDLNPITGTVYNAISGLTADTDVTLNTFQGGVRVHRNITAQTGDVLITANSSNANPGNTTDYGIEIGQATPNFASVIQAGGVGNGQSVTLVSNYGDIWRSSTGLVRAQDVHFVTSGTGAIGWRNGNVANTNILTQAQNITFDSASRVNVRNAPANNPGFQWGNMLVAGQAQGDVIVRNDGGQLTVGTYTDTLGSTLAGIVTSGTGATNGYSITIENVGANAVGQSSTDLLIANENSANRVANDPTAGNDVNLQAATGSILRTGGADAVVTGDRVQLISGTAANNTIGTTASRILTDANEIIFDSGSDATITEEDATLLAGRTRNAGNIDVISNPGADNAIPATITVADLTSNAFGSAPSAHTATQYYGVNADTTGNIDLDARGNQSDVVFEASARSGSGNVTVTAGRDVVDAIAGDITDGLDSTSDLLNIVTGGNGGGTADVTITAGRNIGDKGVNTIDLAAGGRITTTSGGSDVGDGTYLSVLGDANIGNNAIITSARNIDVSTFQRADASGALGLGAQEGDITVSVLMSNLNAGYTRLNASDDIFLNVAAAAGTVAINRGGVGDIVLQARNGGITRTAGTSRLQAQSLHIESAQDVGVNGLGTINVNVPGNVTFSVEQDLDLFATNQLNVSGRSTNGNITLASGGSMRINDFSIYRAWDVAAIDDDINSAGNALQFSYVGGDSGVRANQVDGIIRMTAGGAIQDMSTAEDNNITAHRAILNAATFIGTNNTMGHVTDINTEVAFLEINAGTGFANIREVDSVTIGNSNVGTDLRINSGGFIYQEAGSEIHVGNEVELDTTRDTTIGHATVHSTGDIEIGNSEVLGNFTVQTTGDTLVTGVLRVAGNLALGIGSVDIDSDGNIVGGSFTSGGTFVVDGSGTVTVYGGTNVSTIGTGVTSTNAPTLTYDSVSQTLTIVATGASQEFNLSVVLDDNGAFLNQYETVNGVTIDTVQVDLRGNTGTQLDNAIPIDDAIVWTGGNNSMSRLVVRTGTVDTTEVGGSLQDYDLGQTNVVDIAGRNLNVNSARGANHGIGGTDPSTFGGSIINGGNGSIIELGLNNAFGNVTIRDAYTTTVNNNGDLNLDYINSYGDITAGSTAGSVILNAGAPVNANGNNVTYQAAVNVQQQDATALTSGNRVTAITGTGSVGSAAQRLQVDANEFAFDSGSQVHVEDRFDNLTVAGTAADLVDVLVSAAEAELTVGTVGTQTGITGNTDVILTADNLSIAEAIAANGRVTLQANAAGRDINLGTETAGNLSLTQAELALISANTLQIGNNVAGAIALTDAMDVTGGVTNLRLWNHSTVQADGTGTIAVENLAVTSNGAIDLFNGNDSSNDGNLVTNLAVDSNGNHVDFKNNGALNVADVDGVSGLTATGSDIYLHTSGLISQSAGSNIIADGLELDTTRNTTIGHATVNDMTGNLSLGDSRVQGDYTVTTIGNLIVNGQLLVAGNLTLNGMAVTLVGTGHIVGGTSNVAGITGVATSNAAYSEVGNVGTINATGTYATGDDFDLAALLSDITIGTGVDTIVINLESTNTSYTLALTQQAVDLQGANQIANLEVRTGAVDNSVVAQDLDFNLVQTTGDVDLSDKDVTINAAVGSNFGGNSALNGGSGSYVELANGANKFGEVRVNEAWNTRIREDGTLDLTASVIHGSLSAQSMNGDLNVSDLDVTGTSRLVAVGADADVNFIGEVNFGDHAIAAAGQHIQINNGVTITGHGAMTFVVDENAGTGIGDGWFINEGTITTYHGDVAIYAVGGPLHAPGFIAPPNQIIWGTIQDAAEIDRVADMQAWDASTYGGSSVNHKYATSYQGGGAFHPAAWSDYEPGQGLFGSPVVWFKSILSPIILPPTLTSVGSVSLPLLAPIKQFATLFFDQLAIPPNLKEERYRRKGFSIYQAVDDETGTSLAFSTRGEDPMFNYDLVLDSTYFIEKVSYLGEQGSRRRTSEHVE